VKFQGSEKSDSKGKNEDSKCLEDSTAALAGLREITAKQSSGSYDDKNK